MDHEKQEQRENDMSGVFASPKLVQFLLAPKVEEVVLNWFPP